MVDILIHKVLITNIMFISLGIAMGFFILKMLQVKFEDLNKYFIKATKREDKYLKLASFITGVIATSFIYLFLQIVMLVYEVLR